MKNTSLKKIKVFTALFILGLAISGLTCFPIEQELTLGIYLLHLLDSHPPEFVQNLETGITYTLANHAFMFYSTDWLGFAHLLFAILFYGVYKDPIKNIWITQFGLIACVAIFPLAFIMGPIRGIPFWWQMIDSSFGILGLACLIPVYKITVRLIKTSN